MTTSSPTALTPRRARRTRTARAFTLALVIITPALGAVVAPLLAPHASASAAQSGRGRVARPADAPPAAGRPAEAPGGQRPPEAPPGGRPRFEGPIAEGLRRGRSVVSGRVVYDGTGEPVRGARVSLSSRRGPGGAAPAVFTNARGEFRFENLPAGDYYVAASPPGAARPSAAAFGVPLPSGDPREDDAAFEAARREADPEGGGAEVSVGEAAAAEVEVRVRRPSEVGGTVSGRVLYDDGKPGGNAQIVLVRRESRGAGRRALGPTRLSALADEKGRYSLSGVPPGEYLVRAQLQETVYRDKEGRTYGGLVVRAYYPAAAAARLASPVAIEAGGELSDIDITLTRRPTHALGGTLVARGTGRPLAGVHVRLRAREDADLPFATGEDDRFGWTDERGRFLFDNLADGDYVISFGGLMSPEAPSLVRGPLNRPTLGTGPVNRLPPPGGFPPRPERLPPGGRVLSPAAGRTVETRREVSVAGADQKDLVVEAATGGRVSGVVSMEGGGPLPPRVLVMTEPAPGERAPAAAARVAPDGSFVLGGVPEGPLALNVALMPGYFVRSVSVGGADTGGAPFYVADGAEVGDVRILVAAASSSLTGRVLSPGGAPRRGATVMLVPAGRAASPLRSRLVAVTDPEGRFAVHAGPGEYAVVVWAGRPPGSDEELRALAADAPRVTLREGERATLDLTAPPDR